MKAIMVMFDSLNRRFLEPYGCDWVHTPNFARLAERAVTFDTSYVGSMPCMPARRELHTGRYNFLHRSWGPLEPFDDSMPRILQQNGIYTHLASDHYHYWEDGGCTYHTQYSTWECFRGQEGDPWIGQVADPEVPANLGTRCGASWRQDWINRAHMREEEKQPQPRTFAAGLDFIERNHGQDNWFLHIETFDPHEPYFSNQKYKDLYPHDYNGPHFDWPPYREVQEEPEAVRHCRYESAALHSMCDNYLGRVLAMMDEHDMWKDTMLIVNTDHGFLMGEHDCWGKCWAPFYNEVANSPLFIWDPRSGKKGEHRKSLVQTIDLPATILEHFGVDLPPDMQGVPLRETIAADKPVREAGLFGLHGGHVNITDGRYVYMRAPVTPDNQPLYNYTHMPTHMKTMFGVDELQDIQLAEPFEFTKGCRTMKIASGHKAGKHSFKSMLFDLEQDPLQEHPVSDPAVEKRLADKMRELMQANAAPPEQFVRMGL